MSTPKVIMTGGSGRCGKSITKELIARHPRAASLPFEYRFTVDPDGIFDFYATYLASWSPYIADTRLRRLERLLKDVSRTRPLDSVLGALIGLISPHSRFLSPARYSKWRLRQHLPHFDEHVDTLIKRLRTFSFRAVWPGASSYTLTPRLEHMDLMREAQLAEILREFLHGVINDYIAASGAAFFVEDNTWNPLFAREIHAILPGAKLINVYRDPRDVISSFSKQRWCPDDRVEAALWYRSIYKCWRTVRASLPSDSFLEIKLEDLVADPELTMREICTFADITFDEGMIAADLSRSNSGRWRTEYTCRERVVIDMVLHDILGELHYE